MKECIVLGASYSGLWVDERFEVLRCGSSLSVGTKPQRQPRKPECWQAKGKRKKSLQYQHKA